MTKEKKFGLGVIEFREKFENFRDFVDGVDTLHTFEEVFKMEN